MNFIHFHLIVVHIPVVLFPLGTLLLGLGIVRGNLTLRQTGYSCIAIGMAAVAMAYMSGEQIESGIHAVVDVSRDLVHEHEEIAEASLAVSGIASFFAVCGFVATYLNSRKLERLLAQATVIAGVCATLALGYTAYKGGQIRHTEIHAAPVITVE